MYKLMIVDDEQIVIDAVQYIVNKSFNNVTVISTAKTGRTAIENAKIHHPDIILMDIRMPGINGLDAIGEIRNCNPDSKFVIISAYEQFEFAKQAMELGVEHYVLKPINRRVLVDTITKLMEEIKREEEKKKNELKNIEKLEKIIPYLEQGFIYSILLNTEFEDELQKYTEILDLNHVGGYIMIVQFGEGESAGRLSNKIGSSIIGHKVYPYVRDICKYKCKCVVGPVMINKIIVCVLCEEPFNEYDFRIQTIQLAEEILDSVQKKTKIEFFAGIGGYKSNQDIIYSYNEAVKALQYNRGEKISHILDICDSQSTFMYDIKEVDSLMNKIELGNAEGAIEVFSKITDRIKLHQQLVINHKKNVIIELMVMVHRKAMEAHIVEDSYLNYNDYILEMISMEAYDPLIVWCTNRIKYICSRIYERKEEKGNYIIEKAKELIKDRFKEELTLEELSRTLNISPQYFSKLFKEETGYNFIEYLTYLRIEHSKLLLQSTDLTIKEICYSTGYGDPNYFSRLFKKHTGVSPTTFINLNR